MGFCGGKGQSILVLIHDGLLSFKQNFKEFQHATCASEPTAALNVAEENLNPSPPPVIFSDLQVIPWFPAG